MALDPLLTSRVEDGRTTLVAVGAWTASQAAIIDRAIDDLVAKMDRAAPVEIDVKGILEFDTFGARLLDRLCRACAANGTIPPTTGLPARFVGLLEATRRARQETLPPADQKQSPLDDLAQLGAAAERYWREFLLLLNMLGAIGVGLLQVLTAPRRFRLTATVQQIDRVCWQAVPIILLITFLIGSIIAQQGFFHFRKFGADDYVVDMVGILVLREIGVLIVSIMVAGRSGSSYTAELGSMRMREEIDALRTMGLDPVQVLVLPRVLALVIALPILTFLGSLAALYGGGLVAWLYGGMSPDIYIARLRDAISITHFQVGMIKAPFMALVVGAVACSEGFQVKGSAESLGLRTTASVVKAIFLVIVLDGLFAIFFASIGM